VEEDTGPADDEDTAEEETSAREEERPTLVEAPPADVAVEVGLEDDVTEVLVNGPDRLELSTCDVPPACDETMEVAPPEEPPAGSRAPGVHAPSSQRSSPLQSVSALHGWMHRSPRATSPSGHTRHAPDARHSANTSDARHVRAPLHVMISRRHMGQG
jgi:hypothetical protein